MDNGANASSAPLYSMWTILREGIQGVGTPPLVCATNAYGIWSTITLVSLLTMYKAYKIAKFGISAYKYIQSKRSYGSKTKRKRNKMKYGKTTYGSST